MKAGWLLIVVGLVVMVLAGCGSQQHGEAGDCVSPLKFGERTCVWAPAGNQYVAPGDEVGTAIINSCAPTRSTKRPRSARCTHFPMCRRTKPS